MKPVSKGTTRKFIRVTEDKETVINDLRNSLERNFTGRIQGILKTEKGEIELVIEVLNGKIVAAGVEGYINVEGGTALNTILNAVIEGTGFLEIIDLNEEGVKLDLEFNPRSKLSYPSSLELYINRIELKLRQLRKITEATQAKQKTPSPPESKRGIENIRETSQYQTVTRGKPEFRETKPQTERVTQKHQVTIRETTPIRREEKSRQKTVIEHKVVEKTIESKKNISEEIGLDEEVLGDLVVNVREKPIVIEAIPSETSKNVPTVEELRPAQNIPNEQELTHEREIELSPKTEVPERPHTTLRPEDVLSKLPLDDKIEDRSKMLLTETDRLLLSLIETTEILDHGRKRIDLVLSDAINMSKDRENPLKIGTSIAGKLYYVIVYKGSIVSAFKIDEISEDIELYGRSALIDLLKKSLLEDIDYIVTPIRDSYVLYSLGILKKEEYEKEIEEKAEGLFGKLKRIFGGH